MCSNSSVAHCFSHGECPSADTTAMFIRLCEHFIERNPTELIGESLFLLFQLCWFSIFSGPDAGRQRSDPASLNGTHKHPSSSMHWLSHWLQFPPGEASPVAFLYLFTIQSFYERIFLKSFVWFRIRLWHLCLGQQFAYVCESYRYGIFSDLLSSAAPCHVSSRGHPFSAFGIVVPFCYTETFSWSLFSCVSWWQNIKRSSPFRRVVDQIPASCCVTACGFCVRAWELWENNTAPTEGRAGERTRADVVSDRLGFRGHLSIVHVIVGHIS